LLFLKSFQSLKDTNVIFHEKNIRQIYVNSKFLTKNLEEKLKNQQVIEPNRAELENKILTIKGNIY
jgi:uncharacterized membrane protein required for colicin V production